MGGKDGRRRHEPVTGISTVHDVAPRSDAHASRANTAARGRAHSFIHSQSDGTKIISKKPKQATVSKEIKSLLLLKNIPEKGTKKKVSVWNQNDDGGCLPFVDRSMMPLCVCGQQRTELPRSLRSFGSDRAAPAAETTTTLSVTHSTHLFYFYLLIDLYTY
jgi:hypothetical protein